MQADIARYSEQVCHYGNHSLHQSVQRHLQGIPGRQQHPQGLSAHLPPTWKMFEVICIINLRVKGSWVVGSSFSSLLKNYFSLSLRGVRHGGRRSNPKTLGITRQFLRLLRDFVSRNDVHESFSTACFLATCPLTLLFHLYNILPQFFFHCRIIHCFKGPVLHGGIGEGINAYPGYFLPIH